MRATWMIQIVLRIIFFNTCQSNTLRALSVISDPPNYVCPDPILKENGTEVSIENAVELHKGVTEVKFNGVFGKKNSRRYCKLKCINGEWVGPLCLSDGVAGGSTEGRFQPVYRSCSSSGFQEKFVLSYQNKTVLGVQEFPHESVIQIRCKKFGIYKLSGDSRLKCHNGEWKTKLPSCIPTSSLTNFTDDSAPPSILTRIISGSASIEPNGEVAVYPGSTLHLECLFPRKTGAPEWSWTSTYRTYPTGWAISSDERDWKFLLSVYYVKPQDTGIYTCATPKGVTHSVILNVIASHCDASKVISNDPNLLTHVQGSRVGQLTMFQCREGFKLNGTANLTCQSSGVWSGDPPNCVPIVCSIFDVSNKTVKMVKQDPGYRGTAVFQCPFGHKMIGNPKVTCLETGRWSGELPSCKEVLCPPPLIPINGKLEYGNESSSFPFRVGSLVTFSCKDAFQLIGDAAISCQESGFWSKPPPFCKPRCPHPGDPRNGRFVPGKREYEVNERIALTCSNGFEPTSKSKPKCQKNGSWTETTMECKMKKTFRLSERIRSTEAPTTTTKTTTTTTPIPVPGTTESQVENGTFAHTEKYTNGSDVFYVVDEQPE